MSRMKDAMIETMEFPVIAMWEDQSVCLLNQGIYDLMYYDGDRNAVATLEILSNFRLFTEDFERELEIHEFPLSQLVREKKPFSKITFGLIDARKKRRILQASGDCVFNKETGEYQAGICTVTDVTWLHDLIRSQSEQNDKQFQLICETLPQMVWTEKSR